MNFSRMKLLMLIGLSMMSFASAEEIECEFSNITWSYFNSFLWTSEVKNQAITDRDSTVASFNTQATVEQLYIRGNAQVNFVPVHLAQKLSDLIGVQILGCSVKSVEDHHFQGLHKLIYLNLGHNYIETIASLAFKDNTNLEFLALNRNNIQFINDEIFSQHLKQLHLHDNQIRFIDALAFQNLHNIEFINLDRNNLTHLDPKTLENLVNLKNFGAGENQLESIDANLLKKCKNLKFIWFNGNKLKSIDAEAFDLENLEFLSLRSNICIDQIFGSSDLPEIKNTLKLNCHSELQVLRNETSDLKNKCSFEVSSLASRILALNSSLSEMTNENSKLTRKVEAVQADLNAEKTLLRTDISNLRKDVKEFKDRYESILKSIFGF